MRPLLATPQGLCAAWARSASRAKVPRCLKSLKKSQLACKPAIVVSAGNQAAAALAACCARNEGYGDKSAGISGATGPGMRWIASLISS